MEVNSQEILETLKNKISLYEHLGVQEVRIFHDEVRIRVSLAKNTNHKGTAFGGSLYAVAVLASYAMVLTGLKARKIATEDIVIAKGEITYLRPVTEDFEAVCRFDSKQAEEAFYQRLQQDRRVKGSLTTHIMDSGGSRKASLNGVFVVKA